MPSSAARGRHRSPVPARAFRAPSSVSRHSRRQPTTRDYAVLRRNLPAAATITSVLLVGATITGANAGTGADTAVVTAASATVAEVPAPGGHRPRSEGTGGLTVRLDCIPPAGTGSGGSGRHCSLIGACRAAGQHVSVFAVWLPYQPDHRWIRGAAHRP